MIDASSFVAVLQARGRDFWSGVPCRFLTGLLLRVEERKDVDLVQAANEGDAVAACAGASLAGRKPVAFMQNSGLGNAINPLASLTWTFRIPVLLLVTLRGDPEGEDEPQHRRMGIATIPQLESLEIPWEFLPREVDRVAEVLDRAEAYMERAARPYALIVRSGTFQADSLVERAQLTKLRRVGRIHWRPARLDRSVLPLRWEALERIIALTPCAEAVVVGSTGYISRELYASADRANQLYMVGSMGCAASLGLGISRARPDVQVVIVEGDGAALMRLGNFAMVGAQGGTNLCHVVLDNGVHESTGSQPTLSSFVSLAEVAHACGYGSVVHGEHLDLLDVLTERSAWGARMVHLRIRPGTRAALPRPRVGPEEVRRRFMTHLHSMQRTTRSDEAIPSPMSIWP